MKKLALLLIGLECSVPNQSFASDEPRGTLVELHSCELYAGGCVVSSEATLGGRYLLRAWNFTGGKLNGTDLAGLQVAVLEAGKENLAADKATADQAIVYLPATASPTQTEALMAWIKQALPDIPSDKLKRRIVPFHFDRQGSNYALTAGEFISVKTVPLSSCVFGSCGEELWYTPRSSSDVFTVAVNSSSLISEPMLRLKWSDGGKRSVFVARFGESDLTRNVYVTSADFCGDSMLF